VNGDSFYDGSRVETCLEMNSVSLIQVHGFDERNLGPEFNSRGFLRSGRSSI
jgi:hypothetical protein